MNCSAHFLQGNSSAASQALHTICTVSCFVPQYYQKMYMLTNLDLSLMWLELPMGFSGDRELRFVDLRIARHLCCCCVPVIDGEVEAGSRTACWDEPIAVADLSFWRSAVQQDYTITKAMCTGQATLKP